MHIEMNGITKSFGANNVLNNIDFSVSGGEICALLGENGAGKSTLMNILGGVLQADSGEIKIDGNSVKFNNPAESMHYGIAFIHQELNLINDLAVYENMFISRELKKKSGFLDVPEMCNKSKEIFDKINIDIDPKTMVRSLDSSYKQIVEIARALMMNARIIIMDEPTTSLTGNEIERIFKLMRTLKGHGVGIIFISHKLNEVMEICDRYEVLRDGRVIEKLDIKDSDINRITKAMVGHEVRKISLQREKELGKELLRVENLNGEKSFRNINFQIKQGEVLGFTGLLGDGRSELFQSIFGSGESHDGKILVDGKEVKIHGIADALKYGIGYLPSNRKENGIISVCSSNGLVAVNAKD